MPQSTAFGMPSVYQADTDRIKRQQALAQALQMQAMQPSGTDQMGGVAIKTHPLNYLGKLAQILMASKMQGEADKELKGLGERRQQDMTGDIQTLVNALQGSKPQQMQPDPQEIAQSADYGTPQPQPFMTQAQTPMQGFQAALPNLRSPEMAQFAGQHLLGNLLKTPENPFGKIDPKDYTPDSLRAFIAVRDPSVLVPVRKMEVGHFGGASGVYDPYAIQPGTVIPHTQSPDSAARIAEQQRQWASPSAYQQGRLGIEQQGLGLRAQGLGLERAGLGMRAAELGYNTGQTPPIPIPGVGLPGMGAPQGGGMPQPMPPQGMQPQGAMPVSQMAMPPRVQNEMRAKAGEQTSAQVVKGLEENYTRLRDVPQQLQNIEAAKAIVPQAGSFMGPAGEALLGATKFMNDRLGMQFNLEGVKSAEELRTRIFMNVMDNLKKMDAQPSQLQQQIMQQALGSLGTDPSALPRMLDAYGDALRSKVGLYQQQRREAAGAGINWPHDINVEPRPQRQPGAGTRSMSGKIGGVRFLGWE